MKKATLMALAGALTLAATAQAETKSAETAVEQCQMQEGKCGAAK